VAKNILVVEDDPDMRKLVASVLRKAGYEVSTATNGLEAASSCLARKPDLIISDVHMPTMSGFQMIKVLKAEPGMQDIPVIFLTVDEGRRERGSELGAVAYLTKPLKPANLLATVKQHLP
jgi:CheY-like chemotaxis protein